MADDNAQVEAFAKFLGGLDERDRAAAIAQVKLRAISETPDEAFIPPVRTLREYLDAPIEVPPVLVEPNMVVRGGLNATIGRAGKGKTVLSLNRLLRWSSGAPFFEGWKNQEGQHFYEPVDPLKVLIVENEGAAGLFHKQI